MTKQPKKGDLFNFHETAGMKKFKKKNDIVTDTYDYSKTNIKPLSRILCCGSTGSGKTQALLHYIQLSPNIFSRIIIVHKEDEDIYDYLNDGLNGAVEFYKNLSLLPNIKEVRKDMHKSERILLVIDDFIMDIAKNPKAYPNLDEYFIRGRKAGKTTLFFLSQDYFRIPMTIRSQFTYMLLFNMVQKNDINAILSNFDNKKKELRKIYKNIVKNKLDFMKINTQIDCPDNEKISRNFIDFVEDWSYDD